MFYHYVIILIKLKLIIAIIFTFLLSSDLVFWVYCFWWHIFVFFIAFYLLIVWIMTCHPVNCKPNPADTAAWHRPNWLLCLGRVRAEWCTLLPFFLSLWREPETGTLCSLICLSLDSLLFLLSSLLSQTSSDTVPSPSQIQGLFSHFQGAISRLSGTLQLCDKLYSNQLGSLQLILFLYLKSELFSLLAIYYINAVRISSSFKHFSDLENTTLKFKYFQVFPAPCRNPVNL